MAALQPQVQELELAHVLVVGVGGCTQIAPAQQRAVIEELQERVRRTQEFAAAHAQNRVTLLPGGSGVALLFFGDPETPLRCAAEISWGVRGSERLGLRMGLHSWPVCRGGEAKSSQSVGEGGISLARKVMECGERGHILVSEFVADLLRQLGHWNEALHDIGEFEVSQGVKLHLFNYWEKEAGNPEVPRRVGGLPDVEQKAQADGGGMLGQTVSHYRIVRKLGSGGMGVVYEAEDLRLGRHVAVKILPDRFSKNAAAIERFQREASTASSLNHPNICTIHDVGEYDGRQFIVMELLEGQNLRQVISAGPVPLEKIVALGIQIAAGLGRRTGEGLFIAISSQPTCSSSARTGSRSSISGSPSRATTSEIEFLPATPRPTRKRLFRASPSRENS